MGAGIKSQAMNGSERFTKMSLLKKCHFVFFKIAYNKCNGDRWLQTTAGVAETEKETSLFSQSSNSEHFVD